MPVSYGRFHIRTIKPLKVCQTWRLYFFQLFPLLKQERASKMSMARLIANEIISYKVISVSLPLSNSSIKLIEFGRHRLRKQAFPILHLYHKSVAHTRQKFRCIKNQPAFQNERRAVAVTKKICLNYLNLIFRF